MNEDYFNQRLHKALATAVGAGYNQERGRAVVRAVHSALVGALSDVSDAQVLPEAGLVGALNVEYPDDLDIQLRVSGELRIRLSKGLWTIKDSPDSPPRRVNVLELTRRVYDSYIAA